MSKNPFLFLLIVLTSLTFTRASFAFDTSAQAAYVIDQETGTVLLAKKENVAFTACINVKVNDFVYDL